MLMASCSNESVNGWLGAVSKAIKILKHTDLFLGQRTFFHAFFLNTSFEDYVH